jgi:hypothetical protein
MSENVNDPGWSVLEAGLKTLVPRTPGLNRDALMYRAGRASAGRGWALPLATAALAFLTVGLGTALVLRPEPAPRVVIVHQPAPEMPGPKEPMDSTPGVWSGGMPRYARLLEDVLRRGLDGLPPVPDVPPDKPARLEDVLRSL